MALGIKIKNVKFKNKYTVQELYEAIKDKEFTAGVPELTKHGFAYIITFPALDDQNQVWVMAAGFGKSTNKYSIQKQDRAGVGNLAKIWHSTVLQTGSTELEEWPVTMLRNVSSL